MEELIPIEDAKKDLLSCAIYLAGKINSNESQAITLAPIVHHFLEKGDVDNAAHYADNVNDSYTRNQLFVAVIAKCIELDDDDYAFQLIEAIDESGIRARAKETIALKKASKGDFEGAFQLADALDHSSDALAGIAVNQVKKGFEKEAEETLNRIDFYKSRVEALLEIAVYFLKEENIEKADEYLDKAFGLTEEIEFAQDKIRALLEISSLFIQAEKNDKAIEVLAKTTIEIEKLDGVQKDALFSSVAIGYLRAGSVDLADTTLDAVKDKMQISNCLLGFSQVFDKDGDSEEALESLEESYAMLKSQNEKEIRDSKSRYQLFASIATQFAKFEKTERALEIAHENPGEAQKNSALTNIAQFCILQGNDEMAEQALKGIDSDTQRLVALVAMSDAKKQVEKNDEAIEYLDEAGNLIDTIPQFISRTETQNELAKRYSLHNEDDKSREKASESLQTIGEILGENNRSIALTELTKVYEKNKFTLNDEDKEVIDILIRKSNW